MFENLIIGILNKILAKSKIMTKRQKHYEDSEAV
jgi:hypothetical protein